MATRSIYNKVEPFGLSVIKKTDSKEVTNSYITNNDNEYTIEGLGLTEQNMNTKDRYWIHEKMMLKKLV